MTTEQAIQILEESQRQNKLICDSPSTFFSSRKLYEGTKNVKRRIEALDIAIAALRAQQEPVKLDRSRWKGCDNCTAGDREFRRLLEKWGDGDYCSRCGRPLTEEAWAELERRISSGKTD